MKELAQTNMDFSLTLREKILELERMTRCEPVDSERIYKIAALIADDASGLYEQVVNKTVPDGTLEPKRTVGGSALQLRFGKLLYQNASIQSVGPVSSDVSPADEQKAS